MMRKRKRERETDRERERENREREQQSQWTYVMNLKTIKSFATFSQRWIYRFMDK